MDDQMIAMVATMAGQYMGQELQPEDEFLATPVDAKYLAKHGRARLVHATTSRVQLQTPTPQPATPPTESQESSAQTGQGQAQEPDQGQSSVETQQTEPGAADSPPESSPVVGTGSVAPRVRVIPQATPPQRRGRTTNTGSR